MRVVQAEWRRLGRERVDSEPSTTSDMTEFSQIYWKASMRQVMAYDGAKPSEVAEALQISPDAVRSTLLKSPRRPPLVLEERAPGALSQPVRAVPRLRPVARLWRCPSAERPRVRGVGSWPY